MPSSGAITIFDQQTEQEVVVARAHWRTQREKREKGQQGKRAHPWERKS